MKSIFVCTVAATVMLFLLYRILPYSHDNHSVPNHRIKIDCRRKGNIVNLTVWFIPLTPGIDVDPTDKLVFLPKGKTPLIYLVKKEQLKRSKMEMVIYDKNHDGFVSFSEYGPFQYAG